MTTELIIGMVVALFGGGALATLYKTWLERHKPRAERESIYITDICRAPAVACVAPTTSCTAWRGQPPPNSATTIPIISSVVMSGAP